MNDVDREAERVERNPLPAAILHIVQDSGGVAEAGAVVEASAEVMAQAVQFIKEHREELDRETPALYRPPGDLDQSTEPYRRHLELFDILAVGQRARRALDPELPLPKPSQSLADLVTTVPWGPRLAISRMTVYNIIPSILAGDDFLKSRGTTKSSRARRLR